MIPLELSAAHAPSLAGASVLAHTRAFLRETALPLVDEFERAHGRTVDALEPDGRLAAEVVAFKRRMQQESAAAGLYCPHLRAEDGGLGLSLVDCFYLQEEVYSHGLRGAQWMLAWTDGPSPLVRFWHEDARSRYLADVLAGRKAVAFAATEPGAGSDLRAVEARARLVRGEWLVAGRKHLITGALFAELAQIIARVETQNGIDYAAFLVPLDAPGVERGPVQQTIMADGQTGALVFRDLRLPEHALIGEVGDGLRLAFVWINWTRTRRGGMCSGLAWHCLDRTLSYCRSRKTFGRRIGEHGAVAGMLSRMAMEWEAMRALSLELLARVDAAAVLGGSPRAEDRRDIAILKAWNDEALFSIADKAVQTHGGLGLLAETGLEKIFRVARSLRIPAGTVEIQRGTIAHELLRE